MPTMEDFADYLEIGKNILIPLVIFGGFSYFNSLRNGRKGKDQAANLGRKRKSLESQNSSIPDTLFVQLLYGISVCYFIFKALVVDLNFYEVGN